MKAFIVKSPIGYFAFSEHGELLYYQLFKRNPVEVAEKLREKIPADFFSQKDYEIVENREAQNIMRKRLREYALSLGFAESNMELNKFLSDLGIVISKNRRKSSISRDKLIIQASNALEDLIKIQNLLLERLREWYGLHYPELKQKDIAEMVARYGRRENFPNFQESTGIDLAEKDEEILKEYAKAVSVVIEQRKSLERYVKSAMREIAPNFSSLLEPLLAARLLALAGSLEKLSKMSASTVQLLGAEKALFRHLRGKGRAPKFGIIYLSDYIQNSSEEKRGKVARILASKLMLAARIDFYSGREDQKLKRYLEDEIDKLGE